MSVVEEVRLDATPPDVIVRAMITLSRAIDLYLGDLTRRGYSERTRTTYGRILDELCDHQPQDQDVSKVTTDDLRRFLDTRSGRKRRGNGTYARGTQAHAESVLSSFFKWLHLERKISKNPMDTLPRTRRIPAQDLDVVTVSADDVRALMKAAQSWPERLAIGILVYTGARRRAVARLRLTDLERRETVDLHPETGEPVVERAWRIRFQEKGAKVIWKPVPDELADLIAAAEAAGAFDGQEYLVPAEAYLSRKGERDDRIIWRLVKRVADRAGVETHVHALRAAFACFYLENNQGDIETLQQLMGHRSIQTTQTYLRRLDRDTAMERVRDLSWGVTLA